MSTYIDSLKMVSDIRFHVLDHRGGASGILGFMLIRLTPKSVLLV